MEIFLALAILIVLALFVAGPLRRPVAETTNLEDPRIAELEARKQAKYREIRDAELDREAGKLSQADWRQQDAELRREAIEILKELDALRASGK